MATFRDAAPILLLLAGSAVLGAADALPQGERGPGVPPFYVRAGFTVTVAATDLGETRSLELDDHGTLYLCQPAREHRRAARRPAQRDLPPGRRLRQRQAHRPRLCFHAGWLWFAQSGAVHKPGPSPTAPPPTRW